MQNMIGNLYIVGRKDVKTCENCIHYGDVCVEAPERFEYADECFNFKDVDRFIELPCSIGDYCIWNDDVWYVTGISYFGSDDFLLWMSMADKSPCGAEAILDEVKFISEEEAKRILEEHI